MTSTTSATTIATAFDERVRATPTAIALVREGARMEYAALDALVDDRARQLTASGVRAGDHVGLMMPRSTALIATMLGAWRIGAVVVPIDPDWPAARRARVVEDAAVMCLVGREVEACPGARGERAPEGTALALYTSGSTGEPKAVLLSHDALLWRLQALAEVMPYAADEVACHRTPPTFIDAYAEVFGPLLRGVPVVVLPHPFVVRDLVAAIEREHVSRLLLVPSVLGLLLDARPALAGSALRLIATSGEALSPGLARRCREAAPGVRLVNIYGSTEVAGDATAADIVDGGGDPADPDVSIGRALPGVTVHVVDDGGVTVADGEAGELVIEGPILASGYWHARELTAARFVRSPDGASRWFRTGDRARRRADGTHVLIGRVDDQVKIAGVRIELGEVERALVACADVRDAIAAVRHDADGRGRLVAGLVAAPAAAGALDLEAVRAAMRESLPAAAIPSVLFEVTAIPRTAHGKRDRRAIATASGPTAGPAGAAADDLADRVAAWFGEVVGMRVGPDDVFETVGGDSLARVGLLVRLEREGWHLEHAALPDPLTPTTLASRLCAIERTVAAAAGPGSHVAPAADRPLTDFQRVMVIESLANPGAPMWCDQLVFTLDHVDGDRLAAEWVDIVGAIPALRTVIESRDLAHPRQRVQAAVSAPLVRVDARALDPETYRVRVAAEEWTRLSKVFALHRAPLFELCLLAGPNGRSDLIFSYHHVILDGESARRVIRALLARYAGRPLPAPAIHAHPADDAVPHARWAELLAGYQYVPPPPPPRATGMGDGLWRLFHGLVSLRTRLAARRVRRGAQRWAAAGLVPSSYAGGDLTSRPIARAHGRALSEWSRAHAVTVTAVWTAAFALHLARERSASDVVFGVVVSGRDGRTADAIGMLASCLPLRVHIDRRAPVAALVRAVGRALDELSTLARTPLLALPLDPRASLDTFMTSWGFADDPAWSPPAGVTVRGGRGITMTAPHTALILSPSEVAIGCRSYHRSDRIHRELLALVDRILDHASVDDLLAVKPAEGGLSVTVPAL